MRSPAEILAPLELFGTRLGLDTTRRLLSELGAPDRRLEVVLVAGTNGKGSTAALLAAMATAAGYRTGLYTSPHLESVEERIRVDGRAIEGRTLAERLSECLAAARGGETPTYFEALTVAALAHFAAVGVELAVLEVGLGGRLDATNACEPVLSLITEIGLEHREHLGESLAAIAAEKAGVLRSGRPAVVWVSEDEARGTLRARAAALGAELLDAPRLCAFEAAGESGPTELRTPRGSYLLEPPLAGEHQLGNLGLAVLAAERLAACGWERLGAAAIVEGVRGCRWPGRLERVALPAAEVLLDGAHNPAAAAALSRALGRLDRPYRLLFGALRGKEVEGMLPPLAEEASEVVLTAPRTPRALPPELLRRHLPGRSPLLAASVGEGLGAAVDGGGLTVVCGSLHLVGEARALLTRRYGVPTPAARLSTYEASTAAASDG